MRGAIHVQHAGLGRQDERASTSVSLGELHRAHDAAATSGQAGTTFPSLRSSQHGLPTIQGFSLMACY